MDKTIKVGFAGNPNCGKTTLFNAFTGAKLKVANWPGVTVEKVEGRMQYEDYTLNLIDLPGIYSLTSYSIEEKVTRKCITEDEVDVIVNVVDASNLERNLYLTLQLIEMGKPVIIALNMMDIVVERGMEIDMHRLPEMLGNVPVVPVSARKRTGLDVLMHAVVHHFEEGNNSNDLFSYTKEIEDKITSIQNYLSKYTNDETKKRWYAVKLLERDEIVEKKYNDDNIEKITDNANYEKQIIRCKYDYIEEVVNETLFYKEKKAVLTDKIDKVITNNYLGLPIFFFIMALVFFLTFVVGDFLKGYFEILLDSISRNTFNLLTDIGVAKFLVSLIVNGIIAGVGGILTFLPNIFILFLALAFLEDSGYMSRVAYVMDSIMGKFGLSGKAFLPMVLGFGCSVPAVMATRALERESDRKKVMLLVPFMSCSARLPIYVLFSEMFFEKYSVLVAFSLYILGLIIAVIIAFSINFISRNTDENPLLIELPEYKKPNIRTICIYVWDKVKDYLTKAGTIIFAASIILWILLNCNFSGMTSDVSNSFGAYIGKLLVPVLALAGMGYWQVGVALISGLSAKEVVVSSFAVLYGISNINSSNGMNQLGSMLSSNGFTSINAYAFMTFCLLYTPCAATLATIKKESGSWKFTLKTVLFQLITAWSISTLIYQIGRIIL